MATESTDYFLDMLCTRTNNHAVDLIFKSSGEEPRIVRTPTETKTFLGLLFHMGTINLNRLNNYWKKHYVKANRLDAQLQALPKRTMHKTQSQRKNHYIKSILTPRLQLPSTRLSSITVVHKLEKHFLICDMLQQNTYIDVDFDALIITQLSSNR
jgi:hypothetical protein